eukprot:4276376-Pyramimonas_sp.AAC.1
MTSASPRGRGRCRQTRRCRPPNPLAKVSQHACSKARLLFDARSCPAAQRATRGVLIRSSTRGLET